MQCSALKMITRRAGPFDGMPRVTVGNSHINHQTSRYSGSSSASVFRDSGGVFHAAIVAVGFRFQFIRVILQSKETTIRPFTPTSPHPNANSNRNTWYHLVFNIQQNLQAALNASPPSSPLFQVVTGTSQCVFFPPLRVSGQSCCSLPLNFQWLQFCLKSL